MKWERRLYYLLTALLALPVWLVSWFPSQDGPSHVYHARVWFDMVFHAESMYRGWYGLTGGPGANLLVTVPLGVLSAFLPQPVPEKIVVTLCIVALALGIRYAATAMNGRGGLLANLALPAVAGVFLHLGAYSFLLGVAGFCFALGFWFRRWGVFKLSEIVSFSLLLVAVLLCNTSAWCVTGLVIGLPALWTGLRHGSLLRYVAPTVLAGVPSAILFLVLAATSSPAAPAAWGILFPVRSLGGLLAENPIVSFSAGEIQLTILLTALCALLALMVMRAKIRHPHWSAFDWLAPLAAFLFVLFLAAPLGVVRPRLLLFAALTLLFWVASHRFGLRDRVVLCGAGALMTLWISWSHWHSYREIEPHLKEVMAVRAIVPPGRSVLGLRYAQAALRADPLRTASAYLVPVPGGLWGGPADAAAGLYPLTARKEFDVARLGALDGEPPCVDLSAARIDYVVLTGYPAPSSARPCAVSTYRQLGTAYELIYQSTNRFVLVYRLRQTSSPAPAEGWHS